MLLDEKKFFTLYIFFLYAYIFLYIYKEKYI